MTKVIVLDALKTMGIKRRAEVKELDGKWDDTYVAATWPAALKLRLSPPDYIHPAGLAAWWLDDEWALVSAPRFLEDAGEIRNEKEAGCDWFMAANGKEPLNADQVVAAVEAKAPKCSRSILGINCTRNVGHPGLCEGSFIAQTGARVYLRWGDGARRAQEGT